MACFFFSGFLWLLSGALPFLWLLSAFQRMESRIDSDDVRSVTNGLLLSAFAADVLLELIFGGAMAIIACAMECAARKDGFFEWCRREAKIAAFLR